MPGLQVFSRVAIGKETTKGTPVAPTRRLYCDTVGALTPEWNLSTHEAENRGVRTRVQRATSRGEDVNLKLKWSDGVSYDDLVIVLSQLKGGLSGTGAGTDKSWAPTGIGGSSTMSPETYSIDIGDDVQNWRVQGAMMRSFKIGGAVGELTTLETEWFGQRAVKTTAATPAENTATKIPGDIWTLRHATTAAGLAGASVLPGLLLDWELAVETGLTGRHYMDGTTYLGGWLETEVSATLSLTVESTTTAVSQYYDKMAATTLDFARLKATGPSLGSTNYSAQVDVPLIYTKVQPIGAQDEGVNLYKVEAAVAYDATGGFSLLPVLVCSLAALP